MSTLLTLPGTLLPDANGIDQLASEPSLSEIAPAASADVPDFWQQLAGEQSSVAAAGQPGNAPLSQGSTWQTWFGVRGVTLLLGLMLVAAAIFTHETVINVAKKGAAVAV